MGQRAQHKDMTPDMVTSVQEVLARRIEEALGLDFGRISVKLYDPGPAMPGKTGMEFSGNPPLSEKEKEKALEYLCFINHALGGRPIIKHGLA